MIMVTESDDVQYVKEDNRVINTIEWDRQASKGAERWGLEKEDVEKIVRNPQRSVLDAYSTEVGYPVVKHISGDVVVVTGYRERRSPMVLSVFLSTGPGTVAGSRSGGGKGKSSPTSLGELTKRIKDMGYVFAAGGHPKVIDPETGTVIYTIPGTPSDWRSLANCWKAFLRRHDKWIGTEKQAALEALKYPPR